MTFILLGLPGLALAALAWLTLKDPRFAKMSPEVPEQLAVATSSEVPPRLAEVWSTLWSASTFRHLLMCFAVTSFFGYGVWQWKPAFFIRSYGLGTVEVGTWFAAIYGVCGLLGMYLGGELASRRAAHNESLQLKGIAIAFCGFVVTSAFMYLSSSAYVAFALMAVSSLGYYMTMGPLFATIQTLVAPRMRAIALASIYLFANLIGMGLGPLAVGALSDAFEPSAGEDSLRYALLVLTPGYVWAAWHLWRASRTIERDLAAVHAAQP